MPLDVKHQYVSGIPDTDDDTIVQGSDWNAAHNLTQSGSTLLGRPDATAGPTLEVGLDPATMAFTVDGKLSAIVSGGSVDWSQIVNEPATFPPDAHSHAYSSLTGIPATFAPSAHSHDWADITGEPAFGMGTVTSLSVVTANGLAGTVATATTTPAITLTTSITGILKGNGTAISAAVADTDYLTPGGLTTALGSYLPLTGGTLAGPGNLTMAALTATTGAFSGTVGLSNTLTVTNGANSGIVSHDGTSFIVRNQHASGTLVLGAATTNVVRLSSVALYPFTTTRDKSLGLSTNVWSALHTAANIYYGATSGTVTLGAPAVAGTQTIAWPAASGTVALTTDLASYLPLTGGTLSNDLMVGEPASASGIQLWEEGYISIAGNTGWVSVEFNQRSAAVDQRIWQVGADPDGSLRLIPYTDAFVGFGNPWIFNRNSSTTTLPGALSGTTATFTGLVTALSATAIGAAATTQAFVKASSTANFGIYYGNNVPSFTAAKNSLYINTGSSSTTTRLYINTTGSNVWANFTASA